MNDELVASLHFAANETCIPDCIMHQRPGEEERKKCHNSVFWVIAFCMPFYVSISASAGAGTLFYRTFQSHPYPFCAHRRIFAGRGHSLQCDSENELRRGGDRGHATSMNVVSYASFDEFFII